MRTFLFPVSLMLLVLALFICPGAGAEDAPAPAEEPAVEEAVVEEEAEAKPAEEAPAEEEAEAEVEPAQEEPAAEAKAEDVPAEKPAEEPVVEEVVVETPETPQPVTAEGPDDKEKKPARRSWWRRRAKAKAKADDEAQADNSAVPAARKVPAIQNAETRKMIDQIRQSGNYRKQTEAKAKLISMGPGIGKATLELVNDTSSLVRIMGILILQKTAAPEAAPTFLKLLEDSNPEIRYHSAVGMRKVTGKNVGYYYNDIPKNRKAAVERWRNCLIENKFLDERVEERKAKEKQKEEEKKLETAKEPEKQEKQEKKEQAEPGKKSSTSRWKWWRKKK